MNITTTLFRGIQAEEDFSNAIVVADLQHFKVTHNIVTDNDKLIALIYSTLERTDEGTRVVLELNRNLFHLPVSDEMDKNEFWDELEKFAETLCDEHVIY